MRIVQLAVAAACVFGVSVLDRQIGIAAGSLLLVVAAVALAAAASEGLSAISVASGALGAFASGVLATASPAAAGAALVGLAFFERTLRVRERAARLVHALATVLSGAMAGALSASYLGSSVTLRIVAAVVSTVLVALPLLVEADDAIVHALDAAAMQLVEPARTALAQGAELRRRADAELLAREARRRVERAWGSLARLTETRLRLEHARTATTRVGAASSPASAVVAMVDRRIVEHVAALGRLYAAADTARAAEAGLDDVAVRSVETAGESLDDVSRALVEMESAEGRPDGGASPEMRVAGT
jgi:hypothetical protein